MTEDDIAERDAAVREGRCPERLWPLWPVAHREDELWGLLVEDERIERFSVYGLFPAAYDLVYGDEAADVSDSLRWPHTGSRSNIQWSGQMRMTPT